MAVIFQTALMRLALCGLAASLLLLVLRSRIARDTFARLLSIWRSLTAFGRVAVCSFLLIGVLVGGDKTNGVNNLPPQMMKILQMVLPQEDEFMVSYFCSPELNSVATEVRTGAMKAVG